MDKKRISNFVKKVTVSTLMGAMIVSSAVPALASGENYSRNIKITIDGKEVKQYDQKAFIKNSRTYVPLRVVAEGLNMDVQWDNPTRSITIKDKKANKTYKFYENKSSFDVTDEKGAKTSISFDGAPYITENDRTVIPLRPISEMYGTVEWSDKDSLVKISAETTPAPSSPSISNKPVPQPTEEGLKKIEEMKKLDEERDALSLEDPNYMEKATVISDQREALFDGTPPTADETAKLLHTEKTAVRVDPHQYITDAISYRYLIHWGGFNPDPYALYITNENGFGLKSLGYTKDGAMILDSYKNRFEGALVDGKFYRSSSIKPDGLNNEYGHYTLNLVYDDGKIPVWKTFQPEEIDYFVFSTHLFEQSGIEYGYILLPANKVQL